MNYNDFLRIYYNMLAEKLDGLELMPNHNFFEVKEEEEQYNVDFFEDTDGEEWKIKLGAPSYVYEAWFEKKANMYPEYLFYMDKNLLKDLSTKAETVEQIEEFIDSLIICYKELGTIVDGTNNKTQ